LHVPEVQRGADFTFREGNFRGSEPMVAPFELLPAANRHAHAQWEQGLPEKPGVRCATRRRRPTSGDVGPVVDGASRGAR
jgi:hypothetical protein